MKPNPVIKQVGKYTVGQVVGQGSFGKVYKGINRIDNSQVALKFISKRLIDFIQTPNQMIIITQFAGSDLSNVLQKKRKLTYQQVKLYSKQIFDALLYLSSNRIAHRDLKPQNILMQQNVVKICDFGFARKLSASTSFMNSLKGTPLYIAPQILGNGPLNYKGNVDIWSFGIILYQLWVGRPPFWAQNLAKLKPKILYQKVRFPRDMPIELRAIVDRMLQKNPNNRATWQQLQKSDFFISTATISDKNQINPQINKQQLIKKQSQKQENQQGPIKIANQQDVIYVKKILTQFQQNKLQGRKIRADGQFMDRVISIFGSFFANQGIVEKALLNKLTNLFVSLLTKVKSSDVNPSQDITRRKQLLFIAIKQVQQSCSNQTLAAQLVLIGFLIKINFDQIQLDLDVAQTLLQILKPILQSPSTSTNLIYSNSLKLIGVLINQALLTLGNSQQFFCRLLQQGVAIWIANGFQPNINRKIVIQCLQLIVHNSLIPLNTPKDMTNIRKVFYTLKQQITQALIIKGFVIMNPLIVYSVQPPKQIKLDSYLGITYQCLRVSQVFRKQFSKNTFITDLMQYKSSRIFCFAYDYICIQNDSNCLIPNQVMKTLCNGNNIPSILQRAFYLARAQYYLHKKTISAVKNQSTLKLINQIGQFLLISQQQRKNTSIQLQGWSNSSRIYQQIFATIISNILNDTNFDRNLINQNLLYTILQGVLDFKTQQQIKVPIVIAAKLYIVVQQFISNDYNKNKKILIFLGKLTAYFFNHSCVYQLLHNNGAILTKKLLNSINQIIKSYSIVDEKFQYSLYVKAQQKCLPTLLLSSNILSNQSFSFALLILSKLSIDNKNIPNIIDFTALTIIQKASGYLKLDLDQKYTQTLIHLLHLISLVIKKNQQYASKIRQLDIISHFPRYLNHSNQSVRHTTLTLIGNLAKHSQYFFADFQKYVTFVCVNDSLKRYGNGNRNKILKGVIYAIGNVSFYSDRFNKQFTQLIPYLYSALQSQDIPLISNTMSTISNLLRHSNIYVKALLQNKIIAKVLLILNNANSVDNTVMFGLNMLKKALAFQQIFNQHPKQQFINLYRAKGKMVGQDNQCIKKIKTFI